MSDHDATQTPNGTKRTPRAKPKIMCGPGRTQQHFKDEVDINKIMKKYEKTGQEPSIAQFMPSYGDFSNVDDYKSALDQVHRAQEMFSLLPASIRDRVDNDAGKFIAFAEDPANEAEMIELGMLPEPDPPATEDEILKVEPTPPSTTVPIIGGESP